MERTEEKNAHALTFVCFMQENVIHEDIMYCLPLSEHETAQAMYDVLNNFMEKNTIPWEHMLGLCTDRTPFCAHLSFSGPHLHYGITA